jgi:hypothetical protein
VKLSILFFVAFWVALHCCVVQLREELVFVELKPGMERYSQGFATLRSCPRDFFFDEPETVEP